MDILKNMFLPSKKMIKEQIEWLIEHKYMKRDEDNINMFIYMAWKDLRKERKLQQTSAKNIEAWAWIQAGQIFCAVLPCLKKSISLSARS